ncbi:AAA-like domain-containing protein [Candidatus Marithioploca araucensis]|uniref:AAA-like domain-containing protein n=1 Tax=Candidatus Marithioploca araucensis TaxID=70273 RepID=A0ABT7VSA7_9GAMM|nr:AAA-like domain-containing protein [Candidatus Marithioploca araucensis]
MRTFSSYGPVDPELHYYVPRQELVNFAYQQLLGKNPDKGGHYITVWASRQTGKTWIMREVFFKLQQGNQFDVVILSLQFLSETTDVNLVAQFIARELMEKLGLENLTINTLEDFHLLFKRGNLTKPLILIFDEFDALSEVAISSLVSVFRHIYNTRQSQFEKSTDEKDYLLHGLALIGVRAVLGVENVKGSPFNVQRSVYIPNLTHDEVIDLFNEYQYESRQSIEAQVVENIWSEFQGQPGLTCWFGELLTERYNQVTEQPITMAHFKEVYAAALDLLPNNNILNIISKAKQEQYKPFVLELFQTKTKIKFTYRDPIVNFLYMNGVVSVEQVSLSENYVKFPCPYIQKRLFNYFARELYHEEMNGLYDPFDDLSDTITDDNLNIPQLLLRYEQYLQANHERVLKNAPRREDLRVYEAVFHFHFYLYLVSFLRSFEAEVYPEFPTGNGQIDLLIRYAGQLFGLELKSFADIRQYRKALIQVAKYGKKLGVLEIWLVLFIETVDEKNRQQFEADYTDNKTGVIVHPVFVQTGKA